MNEFVVSVFTLSSVAENVKFSAALALSVAVIARFSPAFVCVVYVKSPAVNCAETSTAVA